MLKKTRWIVDVVPIVDGPTIETIVVEGQDIYEAIDACKARGCEPVSCPEKIAKIIPHCYSEVR